jgi:hypothetical protein
MMRKERSELCPYLFGVLLQYRPIHRPSTRERVLTVVTAWQLQ